MSESQTCSRCDVEMSLQPKWEGSDKMAWYCPCCRSRLQTGEMIEAAIVAAANKRGISVDALLAEAETLIGKPTARDMEQAQTTAARLEAEWTPACEHDTNPWT